MDAHCGMIEGTSIIDMRIDRDIVEGTCGTRKQRDCGMPEGTSVIDMHRDRGKV